MINKKSREEIKLMRQAGNIVALVHQEMARVIEPGISTLELDKIAYDIIKKNKAIPTFLGYCGYPNSICASINEEVVHGIPSKDRILKEGDIVSIDVGATFRGLVGDGAWTYPVGKVSDECLHLMEVTKNALFAGIAQMIPDNKLENVSGAIEDVALEGKVGIVRQYGGHGVGREMHEDPFLFNYRTNSNVIIKKNCAIAIEPMLNLGCDEVHELSDGWTVITNDKKPSAHFEHTVVASEDGPLIMTELL
jgi:methionyl aminopeptidase